MQRVWRWITEAGEDIGRRVALFLVIAHLVNAAVILILCNGVLRFLGPGWRPIVAAALVFLVLASVALFLLLEPIAKYTQGIADSAMSQVAMVTYIRMRKAAQGEGNKCSPST